MSPNTTEKKLEEELELITSNLNDIKSNIKKLQSEISKQETDLVEQRFLFDSKKEELRLFRNKFPFLCKIEG